MMHHSAPSHEDELGTTGNIIGHTTTVGFVGELMSGFLMRTPTSVGTPHDDRMDPAGVLDDEREALRQRIAQTVPDGSRHFVSLIQGIVEVNRRPAPIADLFHHGRELLSAAKDRSQQLVNLIDRYEGRDPQKPPIDTDKGERRRKLSIDQIATTLDLDDDLARRWKRELRLHSSAHRDTTRVSPQLTDAHWNELDLLLEIVGHLVDKIELNYGLFVREVDNLFATENPTKVEAQRVRNAVSTDLRLHERFFDNLDDPAWVPLLFKEKLFRAVEDPFEVRHRVSPASRFLARVAHRDNDGTLLVSIIEEVGDSTENVTVHEDLLRIATCLEPDDAAKVLALGRSWFQLELHDSVTRIVGYDGVVRFPAWFLNLALQIATTDGARVEDRDVARRDVDWLIERDIDDAFELRTVNIDPTSLNLTLQCVAKLSSPEMLRLLADAVVSSLIDLSKRLSEEFRLKKDEIRREFDLPDAEVLVDWLFGDDRLQDGSHLFVPRAFCTELADGPPDGSLAAPVGDLLTVLSADGACSTGWIADYKKLLTSRGSGAFAQRAWIALLVFKKPLPVSDVIDVLANSEVALSPCMRPDYADLVRRVWFRLTGDQQSAVTKMAMSLVRKLDGFDALACLAPLSEITGPAIIGRNWPELLAAWLRSDEADREQSDRMVSVLRGMPPEETCAPDGRVLSLGEYRVPESEANRLRWREWVSPREHGSATCACDDVDSVESGGSGVDEDLLRAVRALQSARRKFGRAWSEGGQCARWHAVLWLSAVLRLLYGRESLSPRARRRLEIGLRKRGYRFEDLIPRDGGERVSREALDWYRRQPAGSGFVVRVALLAKSKTGTGRTAIRSIRRGLTFESNTRVGAWMLLGFQAPRVFHQGNVLEQLLSELPKGPSESGRVSANEVPPEIVAYVGGVLMSRSALTAEFVDRHSAWMQWFYSEKPGVPYEDSCHPSDSACVLFLSLISSFAEGTDADQAFLRAFPPACVKEALLQLFQKDFGRAPFDESNRMRRIWRALVELASSQPEMLPVLPVMSAWATVPRAREVLGASFVVEELDQCFRMYPEVINPRAIPSALRSLCEDDPNQAEDVLRFASHLRSARLLCGQNGELRSLLEVLTSNLGSGSVRLLRGGLIADGYFDFHYPSA